MRLRLIFLFLCYFFTSLNATSVDNLIPKKKNQPANSITKTSKQPINFAFVIPSYNNEQWCDKCLESIVMQTNGNWHIYYMNDASSDKTGERVDRFVQVNGIADKCTIIHNTERKRSLANIYNVVQQLDPKTVVLLVDGDDWLDNPNVLSTLEKIYQDPNVWLTYGNYRIAGHPPRDPDKSICKEFPQEVMKNRTFRKHKWVTHHLRTFYAKLFHLVKKKDLLWDGEFFKVNGDVGFMHPMLEMASKGHIRRVRDILYVYNVQNPINAYKVNGYLQYQLGVYIRALPPYPALDKLF